jgi:hypothetical protein
MEFGGGESGEDFHNQLYVPGLTKEIAMSKAVLWVSTTCVLAIALVLTGCPNKEASPKPSTSPGSSPPPAATGEKGTEGHESMAPEGAAHEGGEQAASSQTEPAKEASEAAAGEYAEALAQLSPEDRALAEKQKVCPVSGKPLGVMGKPIKITVKDRTVFLCCPGCEDAIKKEPDKYLAKLTP